MTQREIELEKEKKDSEVKVAVLTGENKELREKLAAKVAAPAAVAKPEAKSTEAAKEKKEEPPLIPDVSTDAEEILPIPSIPPVKPEAKTEEGKAEVKTEVKTEAKPEFKMPDSGFSQVMVDLKAVKPVVKPETEEAKKDDRAAALEAKLQAAKNEVAKQDKADADAKKAKAEAKPEAKPEAQAAQPEPQPQRQRLSRLWPLAPIILILILLGVWALWPREVTFKHLPTATARVAKKMEKVVKTPFPFEEIEGCLKEAKKSPLIRGISDETVLSLCLKNIRE